MRTLPFLLSFPIALALTAQLGCGDDDGEGAAGSAGGGTNGAAGSGPAGAGAGGLAGEGGGAGAGGAGASGGSAGAGGGAGAGALSVVQLDADGGTTCARLTDGSLRCWGYGSFGQLGHGNADQIGDNETPASAGPALVGGAVTHVAAGNSTCVIFAEGAARCWGANYYGQLGLGHKNNIGDNEAPASAGTLAFAGKVIQVTGSSERSCALFEDGAVRCWGKNDKGQLGYGHKNDLGDDEPASGLPALNLGGKAVAVEAGGTHTCALLEGGSVRCWGENGNGQLGLGHKNDVGDDETPASAAPVALGGKAIQIALGGAHSCALLEGGAVRCWGLNTFGGLGVGNTDAVGDDELPDAVAPVSLGGKATQISAGVGDTCARLEDATLRCWGDNAEGQLGLGNTDYLGDDELPTQVGPVDVGPVRQVAVGDAHVCALLEGGSVRCWGANGAGQLGLGYTGDLGDDELPKSAPPVQIF